LLGVLYKFAWRPILQLLDAREESIRKSLEDADRIKAEMEHLDQKCAQIVSGAQAQASVIIDQSRKTARNAAQIIENKAREEAKIALENTIRDIKEETQSAQARLRKESANIAVELAGKIIEENMSTEKNRALINKYIEKI
jgi:F-type H+-transporting ATPase subunit b